MRGKSGNTIGRRARNVMFPLVMAVIFELSSTCFSLYRVPDTQQISKETTRLLEKVALSPNDGTITIDKEIEIKVVFKKYLPRKKKVVRIRRDDVINRGPSFDSLHEWHQYLHFIIYPDGAPREKGKTHFYSDDGIYSFYDGFRYKPPDVIESKLDSSFWERKTRFPSVDERVRFYMGRWHDTEPNPCLFGIDFPRVLAKVNISAQMEFASPLGHLLINPLGLSPQALFTFSSEVKQQIKDGAKTFKNGQAYTRDIIDLAILHNNSDTPLLIHFSDGTSKDRKGIINASYPVFGKVRDLIADVDENNCRYTETKCNARHSNIIWPLNRGRHFSNVVSVPQNDIGWEKKVGKLIWRGGGFGIKANMTKLSWKQRLNLVKNHTESKYVDAKFVGKNKEIPPQYRSEEMEIKEILKFKYIMSVEGNDVSSGLKWMLFSNSVVFLPPITWASWLMEPILKPFVHYIPVHANMSNVEEMVKWAEEHETEVKQISVKSTLFIYDLLFHPDAYQDEEDVLSRIMERYESTFRTSGIDFSQFDNKASISGRIKKMFGY